MYLSSEVLALVQQCGVILGVGAQAVTLVAFLIATHDGAISLKEHAFGRIVVNVVKLALFLIIVSGVVITLMHYSAGQVETIETSAYLFKWALIFIITIVTLMVGRRPFAHFFWEGILGAHWSALFVVHVLAPLVAWLDIIVLYVLWTCGFIFVWSALVYLLRAKTVGPAVRQVASPPFPPPPPKPVIMTRMPPPPPKPQPAPPAPLIITPAPHKPLELPPVPLPAVTQTKVTVSTPPMPVPKKPELEVPQKPELTVPQKPIEDPDQNPGLPTIRVMPRTEQDVDKQMRPSVVQFEEGTPKE